MELGWAFFPVSYPLYRRPSVPIVPPPVRTWYCSTRLNFRMVFKPYLAACSRLSDPFPKCVRSAQSFRLFVWLRRELSMGAIAAPNAAGAARDEALCHLIVPPEPKHKTPPALDPTLRKTGPDRPRTAHPQDLDSVVTFLLVCQQRREGNGHI